MTNLVMSRKKFSFLPITYKPMNYDGNRRDVTINIFQLFRSQMKMKKNKQTLTLKTVYFGSPLSKYSTHTRTRFKGIIQKSTYNLNLSE